MSLALVTGSNGLVGSESSLFLLDKGFDVIGIDNNHRKFFFGKDAGTTWIKKKIINYSKNYHHYDISIVNYSSLEKIFKKYNKKIDLIIHAAAQPSHDWAYQNPILDFNINSLGTLNLLELTKIYCPKSVFIFTSTNKVYGDNPNKLNFIQKDQRWEIPKTDKYYKGIDEKFPIDDCKHSLFGASKLYADIIVQEYGKNFGLKTVAFRSGCITGPNHSGAELHGFLSYLVKLCVKKNFYKVIGYKGKQVRDNIHSHDLVNCFWQFYKKPKQGSIYNIGGGRFSNCSILEAISIVEKKTSKKIRLVFEKDSRIGDHQWYITNLSKFQVDYPDWKQKYNTELIISELIDSN
jgi:CDP-paratose 2-epimerase